MAMEISENVFGMEQLLEAVDGLDADNLVLLIDAASSRLKKVGTKGLKSKKVATGQVPSQLTRNYEWVTFVQQDAKLNGWEAFVRRETKKDKVTQVETVTEYDMSASVEGADGVYVYANNGETFTHGHAMSYSKILKDRNDPLWQQFLEAFTEKVGEVVAPKVKEVKKISAEEAAAMKAEKEARAAAEKENKALEKAAMKAQKEAEKEMERVRKLAEKEAKEKKKPVVTKVPMVTPVKRLPSPAPVTDAAAAAAPAAAPAVAVVTPTLVLKKKVVPPAPVKVEQRKDTWACPQGKMMLWEWKGKTYVRDYRNGVWEQAAEDAAEDVGKWQGIYNFEKDVIEEAEELSMEVEDDE